MYRTFVSYFSGDDAKRDLVVGALRELGHDVWYDQRDIGKGIGFEEEIQCGIERAHFLVPVLTESAWTRPWVQQEIGYAIRSGLGVLPVAFGNGKQLQGMLGGIQGVFFASSDKKEKVLDGLRCVRWQDILDRFRQHPKSVFRCDSNEDRRGPDIQESAEHVLRKWQFAKVMQRSPVTSFCLPENWEDQKWKRVVNVPGRQNPAGFWPPERISLEKLITRDGCDLIIDPCYRRDFYRVDLQKPKLETLLAFLSRAREDSRLNEKVRVVFKVFDAAESETIIGDHWMAHSAAVTRSTTRRETLSTWHAPTVLHCMQEFQSAFDQLFGEQEQLRRKFSSLTFAVNVIEHALERLRGKRKVPPRCERCRFQCGRGSRT